MLHPKTFVVEFLDCSDNFQFAMLASCSEGGRGWWGPRAPDLRYSSVLNLVTTQLLSPHGSVATAGSALFYSQRGDRAEQNVSVRFLKYF